MQQKQTKPVLKGVFYIPTYIYLSILTWHTHSLRPKVKQNTFWPAEQKWSRRRRRRQQVPARTCCWLSVVVTADGRFYRSRYSLQIVLAFRLNLSRSTRKQFTADWINNLEWIFHFYGTLSLVMFNKIFNYTYFLTIIPIDCIFNRLL